MISEIVWDMYLIKICHSSFTFRASKKSMGMEKLQNTALMLECFVPCSVFVLNHTVFIYCNSKYYTVTGRRDIQHSNFLLFLLRVALVIRFFYASMWILWFLWVFWLRLHWIYNLLLLGWSFLQNKFHQFMSIVRVVLSILQCLFQSLSSVLFKR